MPFNSSMPEFGPEDPFSPLDKAEVFKIKAAVTLEDLTAEREMGEVVMAIEDPETALLFAAGLADSAEADKSSDYIYSGNFAGAVILNAVAKEFGEHRTTEEDEAYNNAIEFWRPVIEMIKMAKSTPNMYEFLISGRDYSKSGGLEGPAYYDEKSYQKAQERFSKILEKI